MDPRGRAADAAGDFARVARAVLCAPHDLSRSPGVSSAGSAAAIADDMVPLALGTQHAAWTTLPASFCGTFAFKPSHGFTSMEGSNVLVPRLSHIGLLARSTVDPCLFAGALTQL
jgi:Asp-tRNA(Asn)/Glu-tRNA(Gln) amidotransferase A subunit family amidase